MSFISKVEWKYQLKQIGIVGKNADLFELPSELYNYERVDQDSNSFYKDLDRYRRHDHGGGDDGDEWLDDHEIDDDYQRGAKKYKHELDNANQILTKHGFLPNAQFDLGEKGHFSINIYLQRDPKAKENEDQFNRDVPVKVKDIPTVVRLLKKELDPDKFKKLAVKNKWLPPDFKIKIDESSTMIGIKLDARQFICSLNIDYKKGIIKGYYNSGASNGTPNFASIKITRYAYKNLIPLIYKAFKNLMESNETKDLNFDQT